MKLTIELSDEKAEALTAQAEARGLSLEKWIAQIAESYVPSTASPSYTSYAHLQVTDPKEWARRFEEWADSHRRDTPLLSDEDISRESIYPDRF